MFTSSCRIARRRMSRRSCNGISSRVLLQEFPRLRSNFGGTHSWAGGYPAVTSRTITDEMIKEYIEEQEGQPLADDSRFPIDPT